jgi:tRNA(adenine34) deaminase
VDCTLYVTVEPCLMCAGALAWSQISRIVYGADDDKRGYHTHCAAPFHPKTVVTRGVLADECAKLMTDFFKKKRPLKIKEK